MSSVAARSLSADELKRAVSILARVFQEYHVHFGIIGGAGCCLIFLQEEQWYRGTKDIDVVIQADPARGIDAERISQMLHTDHAEHFAKKDIGYGVVVPALRLIGDEGQEILIEVEIFDFGAWPNRPQYDLSKPDNDSVALTVDETLVTVLSPRWLLREKILSQKQREGSLKEPMDINDITILLQLVERKSLTLSGEEQVEALKALLNKRPDLREMMEEVIECPEVFNNNNG